MLNDLIKEINYLQNNSNELENIKKDKKVMAEELLKLELKEYKNTSIKDRKQKYINESCKCCRFNCDNKEKILPDDILMPIKSERDYLPSHRCCKSFEWD